jgi:hypothetical protein
MREVVERGRVRSMTMAPMAVGTMPPERRSNIA